ncbi:MAG TPA: NAD(P)H-dependent oxidoreductase [Solirubrobacteraceae bacterium]|nr:NAD(P)H-dependent oxidoreductase [Solirubrobacteraceae bacterium]
MLAIPGSLRKRSYNRALLEEARRLAPAGMEIAVHDLGGLPLYDPDVEAAGDPLPVRDLKAAVAAADGVLIATPEYNRGTSGVLKNALDWLSRPPRASVLEGKPVAVIGGGGGGATRRAQEQVRAALGHPRAQVVDGTEVALGRVWQLFDDDRLTDPAAREKLRQLLTELLHATHRPDCELAAA